MKIHNTLSRKLEEFKPLNNPSVTLYSCGPTVYDHIHIGNLSAFIAADTLRRALVISGYSVKHTMNFTDVDDKTIKRSQEMYPDLDPLEALSKLAKTYEEIFLHDMELIGNDTSALTFVRATDTSSIKGIQDLITQLYQNGFAYIGDDGIYFSLDKYRASGKIYGQLLTLDNKNTSAERINNDEYDKSSIHDFALWKTHINNEPAWDYVLDGRNLLGRPGWHIECSVMSQQTLGQPFDIHTGGVDLIFPHHENEIAQSTAGKDNSVYANFFVHNEHLMVDGRKMSKSLGNYYTLRDIQEKGFEPLAFRLMVLQSHYRSQANFTWESLEAAQNRLKNWRSLADLKWQPKSSASVNKAMELVDRQEPQRIIKSQLTNDLNTVEAITWLDRLADELVAIPDNQKSIKHFNDFLFFVDSAFGMGLANRPDITNAQKQLIADRENARKAQDWAKSDELRGKLTQDGLAVRDTPLGPIWYRGT